MVGCSQGLIVFFERGKELDATKKTRGKTGGEQSGEKAKERATSGLGSRANL